MAHSVAADDAPATLHPLALLLAGQVRTLQEERMRAELLSAVVQPSNAAVFAHLSPEESPAAWHFGPVGGRSDPSQVAPAATAALSAGFAAAFRREFRPVFFELVADAELQGHRRWAGELLGSVRAQSALYFRWLLLHDAVERREAAAARRFAYVLRLRPDILPGCALRPPSVAQLLEPGLDAVALSDQLVLLRRSAVRVALRAYVAAPASPHCRLAPELCVDALLLLANFSLARARQGSATLVRSESMCQSMQRRSELGWSRLHHNLTGARLRRHPVLCGRAALDTGAPRAVPECSRSLFSPRRAQIGDETAEICARTPMRCSVLCDAWRRLEACRCPGFGREPVKVSSVNASALARLC